MSTYSGTGITDFRNFLYLTWQQIGLPKPTPVQYDIANFLQDPSYDRKVIQAFRGVGKSYITSAFVDHKLDRNPDLNILVVSASKDRADQFSTFTMRLIQDWPALSHLRPDTKLGQRNSKLAFDVGPAGLAHMPSVVSKGITGQLTGTRADIIIADDIEVPNNSATQAMRDKLSEAIKEFEAILKPGGEIIFLGTPQCEQSVYNVMPDRGYKTRIWPAEFPEKDIMDRMGDSIAPMIQERLDESEDIVGEPTDPKRFDDEELEKRRLSYGRSGYRLQFMLDTSLSDAERYPLKLRDLIVADLDIAFAPGEKPIWSNDKRDIENEVPTVGLPNDKFYTAAEFLGHPGEAYTGSVMVIDPSGRGADETSYAVVRMLGGYLYLTAIGGFSGGYNDDVLTQLCIIAKTQKVNHILTESNFGDGMFTKLLSPHLRKIYPCGVEEVRNNIQKENRIIDTLEPVMNQHRLVVDRSVIRKDFESTRDRPLEQQLQYQLFYQLTRIQRIKGALAHDDRLDALAMAVGYWVEQMGQDAEDRMAEREDERFNEEIENFRNNALGRKAPVSPSWLDSMFS